MTIKIKQLPETERPYEKLELYGEKMLSNAELLAIIIKSGTKENTSVELANKVLSLITDNHVTNDSLSNKTQDISCKYNSAYNDNNSNNILQSLQQISLEEFQKIKGIGKVKAIQLKAVCELARRMAQPINKRNIKINSSVDVAQLLMEELRFEKVEYAKLLLLNSKNILIRIIDVSKGGTNSAIVEPKEVLQEAIKSGIPKIILVHNHPSRRCNTKQSWYRNDKKVIFCCQYFRNSIVRSYCYWQQVLYKYFLDRKDCGKLNEKK